MSDMVKHLLQNPDDMLIFIGVIIYISVPAVFDQSQTAQIASWWDTAD